MAEDTAAASAAEPVGGSGRQPDQQKEASSRMRGVHRELEDLDRFRGDRRRAEEIDDDNEKSLTNKDALLIETNPLERAEVLANEEAGKRDRMRREDSKKVLQQYIGMQVMAEIKRRKRLRAASKTLDDLELLANRSCGSPGEDSSSDADADDAADAGTAGPEISAAAAETNEADVAATDEECAAAAGMAAEESVAVVANAEASEAATAVTPEYRPEAEVSIQGCDPGNSGPAQAHSSQATGAEESKRDSNEGSADSDEHRYAYV